MGKTRRKGQHAIQALSEAVRSETWAPRYLTHKYWGRKPANVVRRYVEHFTQGQEDPVILDPFCGSGVTCVESLALGKRTVGVDLNPVATLITEVTGISPIDLPGLDARYQALMKDVQAELGWLYRTTCSTCGTTAVVQSLAWEKNEPVELRYTCARCGGKKVHKKAPDTADLELIQSIHGSAIPYWYPDVPVFKGWQTLKLFRAHLKSFADLYTPRNLWALAALWDRISHIEPDADRRILQVVFTSVVAQCTRMIADVKHKGGGPSWKINTYWLPARWQELNVFKYFANRFSKMRRAKEDTNAVIGDKYHPVRYRIYTLSSTNLTAEESPEPHQAVLAPDSVDYVFTDPPYGGEGIQYLELSALWNMWLENGHLSFADEVAFNPYRNLDAAYYAEMLARTFRQVYLALKPGKWMTVTFHNKDSEIWRALLSACSSAGFILDSIVPLNPSAPNLTQKLTKGAPKTDLVLHFRKPGTGEVRQLTLADIGFGDLEQVVCQTAEAQVRQQGLTTTSQVFDAVIIQWFTAHFGRLDAVEAPTLSFSVFDVTEILGRYFHTEATAQSRATGDVTWKLRPA